MITTVPVRMPDYDAIVVGAGHNGLTAAAVMAHGGMRVLCLEKNHFIGGMASTTELIRGYRFELAGSIQFPIPNEIFEDLDLGSCPIYEPEVQSASLGEGDQAPILLYSDPERLLEHLGETIGIEAVLGMAEVAAWAEAPARAIGRFDVRTTPRSLDEMWACAANKSEREAIRVAFFGSVMDVVGRFLPDKVKRGPQHAQLPRRQLDLRGPWSPGSALCLAFALASPGPPPCRKCAAAWAPWPITCSSSSSGTVVSCAASAKVSRIVVDGGVVQGVELGDGTVATAPVVVSNLDPTTTFTQLVDEESLPDRVHPARAGDVDHRAAYFQHISRWTGYPSTRRPRV